MDRTAEWNNRIAESLKGFWAGLSDEEKEDRIRRSFLSPEVMAIKLVKFGGPMWRILPY